MSYRCTRPEWSEGCNDWCPCDAVDEYEGALSCGFNPCEECVWWRSYDAWGCRDD